MNNLKWIASITIISIAMILTACDEPADTDDQFEAPGVTANPDFGDQLEASERIPTAADLTAFKDSSERDMDDTFTLTIADTLSLKLNIHNKSNPLRDLISYSGSVTGDIAGDFTLSQDGDKFLGSINLYEANLRFQLTYDRAEGHHKLYRLKHEQIEDIEVYE